MELSEIPISEMTLETLRDWLNENFGSYVLYGVNHDPSVDDDGAVISVVNGAYHERIGLVEMIKDDMQNLRDQTNDFNMIAPFLDINDDDDMDDREDFS